MTRTANARLAGFTYLFYIAAGITGLAMAGRTHATDVTSVLTSFSALVLGVIASPLVGVILLLQRGGLFGGATNWSSSLSWLLWFPMLIFEVTLALWLLIKGVASPVSHSPEAAC